MARCNARFISIAGGCTVAIAASASTACSRSSFTLRSCWLASSINALKRSSICSLTCACSVSNDSTCKVSESCSDSSSSAILVVVDSISRISSAVCRAISAMVGANSWMIDLASSSTGSRSFWTSASWVCNSSNSCPAPTIRFRFQRRSLILRPASRTG